MKFLKKKEYYGCIAGAITQILTEIDLLNKGRVNENDFVKNVNRYVEDLSFCLDVITADIESELKLVNEIRKILEELENKLLERKFDELLIRKLENLRSRLWKIID